MDASGRKMQMLLFCRFSNSKWSTARLRYNTACASVITTYHKLTVIEMQIEE